jgi:3-hydroxy-9,10-secoandrosta-1,3,5(10)-triene-9,17-dione monooxygenase reductase component
MTEASARRRKPFDIREMRDVLSTFATGVTIVTCSDAQGAPVGITASSFNSVSMEPPLILWSVSKTALSAEAFRAAENFAVHVLAVDQVDLSNRFAKSGTDKFSGVDYTTDRNGVPLIGGTASRFDCSTWQVYEGGDHWIIVGEVENIARENRDGLVFSAGTYASATPIRAAGRRLEPETDLPNPLDDLLLYHLARANRQMGQNFHAAVRAAGLTVPEWRILANLRQDTGIDMELLGSRTFIDPDLLSDLLQSMRANDYCTMRKSGAGWLVQGTSKGRGKVAELIALAAELERQAVGDLGAEGQAALLGMLRTIVSNTQTGDGGK